MSESKTYFLGDTHTLDFVNLLEHHLFDEKDYTVVHVGDCGEGFQHPKHEQAVLRDMREYLESRNATVLICRGNHSNPAFFFSDHWANKEFNPRIQFVPDYKTIEINGKSYQFVGGAISIDRSVRTPGKSWWPLEPFVLNESLANKVDVLVTHSAPSHCEPISFSPIVYGWAQRDPSLLKELVDERKLIDRLFEICKPKLHVYGHFHSAHTLYNPECLHRCLDINEIWTPN